MGPMDKGNGGGEIEYGEGWWAGQGREIKGKGGKLIK